MSNSDPKAFDPTATYVHLPDGGAATTVGIDATFWSELMAGKRTYDGRLMMVSEMGGDTPHWEMHPAGDELLFLVSGSLDVVLDDGQAERRVALAPDTPCVLVPKGVWHRIEVREASKLMFVTPGEGTQHRPL